MPTYPHTMQLDCPGSTLYLPTGHDTQAEMLVTAEYLPATQGVHDPDPAVLYAPSPVSAQQSDSCCHVGNGRHTRHMEADKRPTK